jgi:hypothetical protein
VIGESLGPYSVAIIRLAVPLGLTNELADASLKNVCSNNVSNPAGSYSAPSVVVIVTRHPPLVHTRTFANMTNALFRSFLKMSPSRSATILYAKTLPPLRSLSRQSEQMHWPQFVYRMTI